MTKCNQLNYIYAHASYINTNSITQYMYYLAFFLFWISTVMKIRCAGTCLIPSLLDNSTCILLAFSVTIDLPVWVPIKSLQGTIERYLKNLTNLYRYKCLHSNSLLQWLLNHTSNLSWIKWYEELLPCNNNLTTTIIITIIKMYMEIMKIYSDTNKINKNTCGTRVNIFTQVPCACKLWYLINYSFILCIYIYI